jgi:hypothetical protein
MRCAAPQISQISSAVVASAGEMAAVGACAWLCALRSPNRLVAFASSSCSQRGTDAICGVRRAACSVHQVNLPPPSLQLNLKPPVQLNAITRQAGGFIPAVLSGGLFTAVLF